MMESGGLLVPKHMSDRLINAIEHPDRFKRRQRVYHARVGKVRPWDIIRPVRRS